MVISDFIGQVLMSCPDNQGVAVIGYILKKSRAAKKHVLSGEATVAGMGRQTLACAFAIMILCSRFAANGTAVVGVCVTGEASRQFVPVVWQGTVPVASQYGAIFAPGLTERSERQASRCARALSRSRYK